MSLVYRHETEFLRAIRSELERLKESDPKTYRKVWEVVKSGFQEESKANLSTNFGDNLVPKSPE